MWESESIDSPCTYTRRVLFYYKGVFILFFISPSVAFPYVFFALTVERVKNGFRGKCRNGYYGAARREKYVANNGEFRR